MSEKQKHVIKHMTLIRHIALSHEIHIMRKKNPVRLHIMRFNHNLSHVLSLAIFRCYLQSSNASTTTPHQTHTIGRHPTVATSQLQHQCHPYDLPLFVYFYLYSYNIQIIFKPIHRHSSDNTYHISINKHFIYIFIHTTNSLSQLSIYINTFIYRLICILNLSWLVS